MFVYSEKAAKFCKISTLILSTVHSDKSKVEITQNYVAFSEYMNFNIGLDLFPNLEYWHTCSSPALTQNQSNAKNIYVSNRSYSILRWLMIIKLNLWVKKAICSVKAFAPHMCFVIRQKVMDTTVKTYLYEPFFIVILKRCLYTMESKNPFLKLHS